MRKLVFNGTEMKELEQSKARTTKKEELNTKVVKPSNKVRKAETK